MITFNLIKTLQNKLKIDHSKNFLRIYSNIDQFYKIITTFPNKREIKTNFVKFPEVGSKYDHLHSTKLNFVKLHKNVIIIVNVI